MNALSFVRVNRLPLLTFVLLTSVFFLTYFFHRDVHMLLFGKEMVIEWLTHLALIGGHLIAILIMFGPLPKNERLLAGVTLLLMLFAVFMEETNYLFELGIDTLYDFIHSFRILQGQNFRNSFADGYLLFVLPFLVLHSVRFYLVDYKNQERTVVRILTVSGVQALFAVPLVLLIATNEHFELYLEEVLEFYLLTCLLWNASRHGIARGSEEET